MLIVYARRDLNELKYYRSFINYSSDKFIFALVKAVSCFMN